MANTIRIKRRAAGGAAGAPASMANAELAFNEQDDTLYYGKGTGGAGGTATQALPIAGPGAFAKIDGSNASGSWAISITGAAPWGSITGKPTTLAGYGITDAESTANKGVAGGYASLDGTGKVPSSQLPAFVDDVLEYANLAGFPATGATGVLYVALDTNKVYRWSGSAYVEISGSPGSTDAVPEGATNLYFTDTRARDAIAASGSHTWGGAAIPATKGGTGQTSFAVGDLLYASTTTALSKLAGVATGNALISGGVGAAPSWGKVGLTTHVSGTLPVANGGTGVATLTGLAKGNGTGAFTAAVAGTDYHDTNSTIDCGTF